VQALACLRCGNPVEDEGLCVECWDRAKNPAGQEAGYYRGRVTNRRVWAALDRGLEPAAVAAALGISKRTVVRHRSMGRIYR
jgi:FixJ family two-component response regulator